MPVPDGCGRKTSSLIVVRIRVFIGSKIGIAVEFATLTSHCRIGARMERGGVDERLAAICFLSDFLVFGGIVMKLLAKVLAPIALLIVVIVGVNSYVSYKQAAEALAESIREDMEKSARGIALGTQKLAKTILSDTQRTADRPDVVSFLTEDQSFPQAQKRSEAILNDILATYPDFSEFLVAAVDGAVVASSLADNLGKNLADKSYFAEAAKGKNVLFPAYKNPRTGNGALLVASPVKDNGEVVGVLVSVGDMAQYYTDYIDSLKIGKSGYGYVLNRQAQFMAHPDRALLFRADVPHASLYRQMIDDKEGEATYVDASGKKIWVYYMSDAVSRVTVGVQAEYDDLFASLAAIRNSALLFSVVYILAGALVVFAIVRPIIRALNKGVDFAGQIAAGNLHGTLDVRRNDEIGKLAEALRTIPQALQGIVSEYAALEKSIEEGRLDAEGDAAVSKGDFSRLIQGTNAALARFRTLLDEIPSPTVMLNKNMTIAYCNIAARNMAQGEYMGRRLPDVFALEDAGADVARLAVETARPASAETRARPGGKQLDVSCSAIPMFDKENKLASVLVLITDLTHIKDTERTILDVGAKALTIAGQVAAASEALSVQVRHVSKGAEAQQARITSTAAAMTEMDAAVQDVSAHAEEAAKQSEMTKTKAMDGARLVNEVVEAVNSVNAVADRLQGNMRRLGELAANIDGVMGIISDIADQTNLLALNAAIEAARAGEAGRGFAVVADEVRKLAEKTMQATQEVGGTIHAVQQSANANIAEVEAAVSRVGVAAELADTSGVALTEIVSLASASSQFAANIAAASEQQGVASRDVSEAVEEVNRIVTETTEGMAQAASSVQDLFQMAQDLRRVMEELRKENA